MATILVIDDQKPIRTLLRLVLEGAGHDVLEASSGRLGLELYRERSADLIITDIVMPEMDGLELMLESDQELSQRQSHCHVRRPRGRGAA